MSWATDVRDYLQTKGVAVGEATAMGVFVARMVAANPADFTLVKAIEGQIGFIMAVYAGVYGLGLNAGQITTWILANRPDLANVATLYGNVIATDIPAMIDSPTFDPSNSTTWSLKNLYLEAAAGVFKMVCYYMRHFCINKGYATGHANDPAYATSSLQPSTSIPGVSEYLWN